MSVAIGQTISHYQILEKLGEGGMGVVYKARDTSLNREVALKFLPPHLTKDFSIQERFIVEAQAASALDHPNICNIHEINESLEGQLYICMAYYEGESLQQRIKKGPIPWNEAIDILIQIVHGLKAAHEKDIIHRDIKPSNIIITNKGEAKIVDFGLAKLAGSDSGLSFSSTGTTAYLCPEQIRRQTVDQRCDLWSLGIVFYEMLTGHLPFQGEYPESIMYAIVNKEPRSLSHYLKDVPELLQIIINKLLKKDPNERYQNLSELQVDLELLSPTEKTGVVRTRSKFGRQLKRKSNHLYIGSAIFLMILLVIIIRLYLFSEPFKGNLILVLPQENIAEDSEQAWFTNGMTDVLITDLAQISGLRVIHRSTALKYKGTTKSPSEIAAELGVDYMVEPLVIKEGGQVKISTKLINTSTNEYIWAKKYEGEFKDILTLFGSVSQDIAREIEAKLTTQERAQFAKVQPIDPEAYELYLKGYYYLNTGSYSVTKTATDYFNKAIELDSTYALAYVGLGVCYGFFTYYGGVPREEGIAKIRKLINKALAIDENIAEIYHLEGAFRLWQLWDWEGSGKAFMRAISLNPNVSGILKTEYLWYLIAMGRFEKAIIAGERLLELDPLSPVTRSELAKVYFYARQYDKAIELCQRTIELDLDDSGTYLNLASNYEHLGKHDDAHKCRIAAMKLSGIKPERIANFDSLYTELGAKAYPTWQLMEKKDWFDDNPTRVAEIYTQLGEKEKAVEWLEKAYEKSAGALATLNTNPTWDPLRGEPPFQSLLRRMNFPN